MPIYEYECGSCGHRLEALQKISDAPLVYCPECNADQLRKQISAAAFRLKGTGWYETDFKGGDKKDDKADTSAGKSSTDSGDNKPASKGDSGDSAAGASKSAATTPAASSTSPASA